MCSSATVKPVIYKFLNINEELKDKELTLRETVLIFLAGKVTQTV